MKKLFLTACLLFSSHAMSAEPSSIDDIVKNTCAHCHGVNGEASSLIYPRLAGQNESYIAKQLNNFRDGSRKSTIMNKMAESLTDEQIAELAALFSSKPKLSHRIRKSLTLLASVGEYIYTKGNKYSEVPACASCHGDHGEGSEELPRLAGQHKNYIVDQLQSFHERNRNNDNAIMTSVAQGLTELEIQAVALYASGLKTDKSSK